MRCLICSMWSCSDALSRHAEIIFIHDNFEEIAVISSVLAFALDTLAWVVSPCYADCPPQWESAYAPIRVYS